MKASKGPSLVDQALKICTQQPEGVLQATLEEALNISAVQCLELVNTLLRRDLVEAFSGPEGLVFKPKDAEMAAKMKGLTEEDMLVYQAVKNAKRNGIWSRDIGRRNNLVQATVTKSLKTLETRELVKPVKSVNDGKRKIYVLFDVEPANELTGGLWFQGTEMDLEFITILQQQCQRFIADKGIASVEETQQYIQKAKILNVPVDEEQISAILQTLQYDGVLERVAGPDGEAWQIAGYQIPDETAFTAFPCGTCPVIEDCTPGGQISPEKCIYFDEYLQF